MSGVGFEPTLATNRVLFGNEAKVAKKNELLLATKFVRTITSNVMKKNNSNSRKKTPERKGEFTMTIFSDPSNAP